MLSLWLQAILPLKRRRQRRKQGSLKWMRLCQYTGGTVMKRCTLAATSTPAVESTCSNLTTPIHSGAPRVSTTESTTPDKPEYRQWEIQGVCVCANGDICEGSLCLCVWMIWKTTRGRQRDKTGASTSAKMLLLYVCVCVCSPVFTYATSRHQTCGKEVCVPVVKSLPVFAAFIISKLNGYAVDLYSTTLPPGLLGPSPAPDRWKLSRSNTLNRCFLL